MITLSQDLRVAREINLLWGVRSVYVEELTSVGDLEHRNLVCIKKVMNMDLLGEDVCICCPVHLMLAGSRNLCLQIVVGKAHGLYSQCLQFG